MTTRWADGFEEMATGVANFATDYSASAGTGLNIVTGRRTGTQALSTVNGTLIRSIGGTEATIYASIAINPQALGAGMFMRFLEAAVNHIEIRTTAAGALAAYRAGATLLGTSAAVLSVGSWYWLQVKVVISDTVGVVEIRDASGGVLLNLTAQDTRNAGTGFIDTVHLSGPANSTYFDDWHVWDSTGTICNNFTNDTRIDHKLPDAAGNYAQFTPLSGSNFSNVDETTWNSTDYVDSSTAGHKDSYTFGYLSHAPPSIYSVLRTVLAQKDDAGARSLKPLTRIAATDYVGTAVTLNQGSYARVVDVQETNPNTGVAWTQAGVNGAEFGFENV